MSKKFFKQEILKGFEKKVKKSVDGVSKKSLNEAKLKIQ